MRYPGFLSISGLSLALAACAFGNKPVPPDTQCTRALVEAQNLYLHGRTKPSPETAKQVAGLITAAKIDREDGSFMNCLDKASRATALLKPDAGPGPDR